MTPDQEAKLTQFIESAQAQNLKMDGLLAGLNQLVPQVRDNKSDVRYLRSEVQKIHAMDSAQTEQIKNLGDDVDSIGNKQRKHDGNSAIHRNPSDAFADASLRWGFMAKVAIGLTAFTGLVTALAKAL